MNSLLYCSLLNLKNLIETNSAYKEVSELPNSNFRYFARHLWAEIENYFQASSDSDEESRNDSIPLVDVRMIDFAHVFSAGGDYDENYLYGLNNLISSFQSV